LVEPPLDQKSLLAVLEPGTLVILPTAACQVELFLAACSIPFIPKFEEPVMARAHNFFSSVDLYIFFVICI